MAQEQASVHSDSSEWVHDGVADGASHLVIPGEGVHLLPSAKTKRNILAHCPAECFWDAMST